MTTNQEARPTALSLCTGMGLLDKAFADSGFDVTPGCEIDPEMRDLHAQLVGGDYITHDIDYLPDMVRGKPWDVVIGGPPCQAHTRLRSIREPKFPDLTSAVQSVLDAARPRVFLLENVNRVRVSGAAFSRCNAMHYAKPHQSRSRWFSHSPEIEMPAPLYSGTVDDLMAYSIVAGRIYGRVRAARLQGYPDAAALDGRPLTVVRGLVNAVHYELGLSWAGQVLSALEVPSEAR